MVTREQIAELGRTVVEGLVARMLDERSAPHVQALVNAFPRLVAEREALLEALRHVDFVLKEDSYRGTYVGPYIAKAIANVEAP